MLPTAYLLQLLGTWAGVPGNFALLKTILLCYKARVDWWQEQCVLHCIGLFVESESAEE